MQELKDGTVLSPGGFRASGVRCGLKAAADALDLALVVSDGPSAAAGVFTTNQFSAAPVQWSRRLVPSAEARAVIINSGCANACTGWKGLEDTRTTAAQVASAIGCKPQHVLVGSTGIIGKPLAMERVIAGINMAVSSLSDRPEAGLAAARAIMTTDTRPKHVAVESAVDETVFRVGGMAKGAGMIAPNLATMLAVVTTDAAVDPEALQTLTAEVAARTFNRVLVDGDTSTNDSVFVLANGRSGMAPLQPGSKGLVRLREALEAVMLSLAHALVRDGEGATKFIEVRVTGGRTEKEAEKVAGTIARSPLVKCAAFGRDPNWGRVLCAAGYAGVPLDPTKVRLWIGDVLVLDGGLPTGADAAAAMAVQDIVLRVDLGAGSHECSVWTCDFSHEYVTINAEYHT